MLVLKLPCVLISNLPLTAKSEQIFSSVLCIKFIFNALWKEKLVVKTTKTKKNHHFKPTNPIQYHQIYWAFDESTPIMPHMLHMPLKIHTHRTNTWSHTYTRTHANKYVRNIYIYNDTTSIVYQHNTSNKYFGHVHSDWTKGLSVKLICE